MKFNIMIVIKNIIRKPFSRPKKIMTCSLAFSIKYAYKNLSFLYLKKFSQTWISSRLDYRLLYIGLTYFHLYSQIESN